MDPPASSPTSSASSVSVSLSERFHRVQAAFHGDGVLGVEGKTDGGDGGRPVSDRERGIRRKLELIQEIVQVKKKLKLSDRLRSLEEMHGQVEAELRAERTARANRPWITKFDAAVKGVGEEDFERGVLGLPSVLLHQLFSGALTDDAAEVRARAEEALAAVVAAINGMVGDSGPVAGGLDRRRLLHVLRCVLQFLKAADECTVQGFKASALKTTIYAIMTKIVFILGCIGDWKEVPKEELQVVCEFLEEQDGTPQMVRQYIRAQAER